jgi:chromosomal replication initiator protein
LWQGEAVNLAKTWNSVLGSLELQLPRSEYNTWLRRTELVHLDNNIAVVSVNTPMLREAVESRYSGMITTILKDILGYSVRVRVVVGAYTHVDGSATKSSTTNKLPIIRDEGSDTPVADDSLADLLQPQTVSANDQPKAARPTSDQPGQKPKMLGKQNAGDDTPQQIDFLSTAARGMLNQRFTFDRFIIGSSNRLASAACMAVADHPAQAYNPLFLYGGVGLGKTHLLHAIGNAALSQNPDINVLYVSSEKFTNDLINAIRRQQTEEFRNRYRNIDILLIDDIQFIAGKDATQEEFFHTFNTLHTAGKQVVMTSDRPPKAILTLEERLRSRFEWGLIVDVQLPDYETRIAILRTKAEQMTVDVPPAVIEFLAQRIQSNIRELEGSLNRVVAFAKMNGTAITVEGAQSALSDLLDTRSKKRVTADVIVRTVCEFYGIDLKTLQGRGRSRNIVMPRQIAMYLLREETDASLVDIGVLLGGRDHTTIMYGCEKITDELITDTRLKNEINTLREKFYS